MATGPFATGCDRGEKCALDVAVADRAVAFGRIRYTVAAAEPARGLAVALAVAVAGATVAVLAELADTVALAGARRGWRITASPPRWWWSPERRSSSQKCL